MIRSRAQSSVVIKRNIYDTFATDLNAIWRADSKRRPLGLAISGGVDSMALAKLCHKTRTRDRVVVDASLPHRPTFKAFIVNHNLRPGSGDEACRVADELNKLDITSQILHLQWPESRKLQSLSNLESAARRLRYQALGRACRESGITSLLVAHHANDQAETGLMRIVSGYTGIGLSGMKSSAPLPECSGIYGVDCSGDPVSGPSKFKVEHGGVQIHRPLLQTPKEQLVDICQEHSVRWVEDPTNADVTLTLRNAVRSLLKDENVLPEALRHSKLLGAAEKMARKKDRSEAEATKVLARMSLSLNVRSGQAAFTLDRQTRQQLSQHEDVAGRVLRRILIAVSPKSVISLQDLDQALELMLGGGVQRNPSDAPDDHVHLASVQLRRLAQRDDHSGDVSFTVSRQLPPRSGQKALAIQLWPQPDSISGEAVPESQAWRLWDGRYWICAQPPHSDTEPWSRVVVRLLNRDGLAKLQKMSKLGRRTAAGEVLRRLKEVGTQEVRYTLPAVFLLRSKDGVANEANEEIVALPSLSWYADGWTGGLSSKTNRSRLGRCEIRYKRVELGKDQVHDSMSGIAFG